MIGLVAVETLARAATVAFRTNDVIALSGGSNIERTRFNGFLQTHLLAARPELTLRVRNLGWEGDTVFEQWRDTGGETWRQQRDWRQQLAEIGATVVTWVFAAIVTFILLKILDVTMGLRLSQEDEIQGLDYSQHGEEGYIFL